ncbi:MAG: hypothetical protein DRJ21_01730 [Candidatus Methanomethylicota archaeon]|uniref:Radical SAM core domain-containing protein n=1 Tax=Thermoproteota archaeon TaxID=2056631 RepID=A0A497ET41_9CREN|nr:MAG: hypothetical protein DRJ21_01730 [Candidatus Verstraetearchaeota archaeon]
MRLPELNVVIKNWRKVDLKFALCYPSRYRVGMACLAIHLIYDLLNSIPNVLCERAFLDVGFFRTIESNRKLLDFDVIGFSLQYEMDYVNFVRMLLASNIPPYSRDRNDSHPIILVGGAAVTANPEPIAPIADAILIGEIEPIMNDIVAALQYDRREKILEELSQIRGIYIPIYNNKVDRVWAKSLNDAPHAINQIIPQLPLSSPYNPIFGRAFLLEITRGCNWGCKFCLEGYNYLPMRQRSIKILKKILNLGLKSTNVKKVVIIGSAAFNHSNFEDLCEHIVNDLNIKISIPSIRASFLNEKLASIIVKGGQRTITFAPETGNDLLREVIGKRTLSNDEIVQAARIANKCGIKQVKLYFMIGLPGESISDIESIAILAKKIADQGFTTPKSVRLTINPFIPKANTPFQWFGIENVKSLRTKIKFLKTLLARDHRIELRMGRLREYVIQAFLSTSGRSAAEAIILAAKSGGTLSSWRRVEKLLKISIEEKASTKRDLDDKLPWNYINSGVSRDYLLRKYMETLRLIEKIGKG